MDNYSANDKQLLDSGLMADVTVQCGDREWKLHKLILISRSEWFKKALCGNFKEAEDNRVVFDEKGDLSKVDWTITWIYTRALPTEPFENESALYKACVELHQFSDFLLLKDLKKHVEDHLQKKIRKKVIWAQKAFRECYDITTQVSSADLGGIFKGIATAWKNEGTDWAKALFLSFPASDHYWIVLDDNFRQLGKKHRRFYHEMLENLAEATAKGKYWPFRGPRRCAYRNCKADKEDGFYWAELGLEDGQGFAKCHKCAGRPDNDMVHFEKI